MEKQLNPNVPAEAVEIIDILTQKVNLNLPRVEVGLFNQAIHTLRFYYQHIDNKNNQSKDQETSKKEVTKTPGKNRVSKTVKKVPLKKEP